jgi:hypothetical protein
MIDQIKSFLLITILMYAIVISVLYWTEYTNKQKYLSEKTNDLNYKENQLSKRENLVVDKEVCFRELTKLQTIQNSVLELLKSYSYTQPIQQVPQIQQLEPIQNKAPSVEIENILT